AGSLRGGRRGAALGAAGFAAAGPRCEDAGPRGGVGPRGGCGGVRIKAQNRLGSRKTPRQPLAAWRLGFWQPDSSMLIDVHAHFYHDRSPRADWRERHASRLAAGEQIGITIHVASILGSWGRASPTYFPSPADLPYGNDALLALAREHPHRVRGYV